MSFFIPEAMAAAPAPQGSGFEPLIMLAVFGVVFYLLIWRPQSKRAKAHKDLIADLDKGDEIITSGGLAGKVMKVTDDFIVVEISKGIEVKVQRVAVVNVLPKGTLKEV